MHEGGWSVLPAPYRRPRAAPVAEPRQRLRLSRWRLSDGLSGGRDVVEAQAVIWLVVSNRHERGYRGVGFLGGVPEFAQAVP